MIARIKAPAIIRPTTPPTITAPALTVPAIMPGLQLDATLNPGSDPPRPAARCTAVCEITRRSATSPETEATGQPRSASSEGAYSGPGRETATGTACWDHPTAASAPLTRTSVQR